MQEDLASLQTKGELDGDEWVINGQKIWTSTAKYAQMMFCLVRTEPDAPKHQGISYLLIPMDAPGIEVRPLVDMTLDAGFNEVFFTDVRIPADNIVGERGQGWLVANKTLVHERGSLGDPNKMIRRYDKLVNLMKSEILDGTRIIDKPVYRDRLMRIQGKILALKSHGLRLLSGRLNKGQDISLATMIVKLYGTEMRYELESLAIDVMGELGTLYDNSPNLRDNGGWQYAYMYYLGLIIGGGTSQIQKNIIAERGSWDAKRAQDQRSLTMYFGLSEEQQFFQESINKFLDDTVTVDSLRSFRDGKMKTYLKLSTRALMNLVYAA